MGDAAIDEIVTGLQDPFPVNAKLAGRCLERMNEVIVNDLMRDSAVWEGNYEATALPTAESWTQVGSPVATMLPAGGPPYSTLSLGPDASAGYRKSWPTSSAAATFEVRLRLSAVSADSLYQCSFLAQRMGTSMP